MTPFFCMYRKFAASFHCLKKYILNFKCVEKIQVYIFSLQILECVPTVILMYMSCRQESAISKFTLKNEWRVNDFRCSSEEIDNLQHVHTLSAIS